MSQGRAGVLMDVDGTLLDTNYLHTLAWWQAIRDARLTGVSMADTHQAIGIADDGLLRRLVPTTSRRRRRKASKRHSRRYARFRSQVVAFDGAAALLRRCADIGLAVVLATSGQASDLDWMLPAIGVPEDLILGFVTSADVEQAKPAPDLLRVAMERYDLDPERTIAVGDTVWDIDAAHDADLPLVAFTSGGISACQLRTAGADEVYAGPADLLGRWSESALSRLA